MNEFLHTKLGFCFWDIPALLVLLVIVVLFVVHIIRQNSVILNCTDCDGLLLPPSHLRALSAVAERREGGDLAAVVVPGEPRVPALRGLRRQRPVQQRDRR